MKYIITYCIICLCAVSAFAQRTPVITYNPVTKTVDKQIPFDVPFIIKISQKNSALVDNAFMFIINNTKDLSSFNTLKEADKLIPYVDSLSENNKSLEISRDKNNVYLKFKPIKPGVNFGFFLLKKYDKKEIEVFFKFAYKIYNKNKNFAKKLKNLNKSFIKKSKKYKSVSAFYLTKDDIESTIKYYTIKNINSTFSSINQSNDKYSNYGIKNKWQSESDIYRTRYMGFYHFYRDSLENYFDILFRKISFEIEQFSRKGNIDVIINAIPKKNGENKELIQMAELLSMPGQPLIDYIKGVRLFASKDIQDLKDLKIDDIEGRVNRINRNILFLIDRINDAISARHQSSPALPVTNDLDALVKYLEMILFKMDSCSSQIEMNYNEIIKLISSNSNLRTVEKALLTTDLTDLETEAGVRIFPSVGYAFAFPKYNGVHRYYPSYIAGVRIAWQPVNKNLRLRDYCHLECWDKIKRLTSLEVAAAFTEPRDPEFQTLTSNFSLIVGLNVRVLRVFYLSGGTMLLREVNANPVITDARWKAAPYVGLSLDIDVAKLLKDIIAKP